MNQSNWFSIDDLELQHQTSPANPPVIKERKLPEKLDMDSILSQYKQIEINSNLIKYIVFENETTENTKQINVKSKIKLKCEERDLEGNLANKGTNNIQATKISMASSIPYIQGLKSAFLTMKEGDIAWFKLSNEQMYTEQEIASGIPVQNLQKYFKIDILEVTQPELPIDLTSLENRLKQMELFKIEGNQFYEKQQYQSALLRYQRGLNFLEKWPKKFESNPVAIEAKRNSLLVLSSNKAQCLIKLQDYKQAISVLEPLIGQMRNKQYEVKNYYRLISCFHKIDEQVKADFYYRQVIHMCQLSQEEKHLFNSIKFKK
ncbi:unnamed protein product [Paramecium primaurelia]|uniref:Peptidylprolyl isomerase n=1 Tax=Paramecium primaurelia TaxID=5886 RepID=A0A8S1QCH6_PARPR|nr:unnamed protein product [Paramecium primaurelia]